MGFLLALLSFVVAEEVVELEPVRANFDSSATIHCAAITTTSRGTLAQARSACDGLPGCTWLGDSVQCAEDTCLKYGNSTQSNTQTTPYSCACTGPLSYRPSSCTTGGTWTTGYPSQIPVGGTGTANDYYCQRASGGDTVKATLDECRFQYLYNGSCTAPYCYLSDYAAAPEGGKICNRVPACAVLKIDTDNNKIRIPTANIASCFNARIGLGEESACNQNPGYYMAAGSCVKDNCYGNSNPTDPETGAGCPPAGSTACVGKAVKGVSSNAVVTKYICVESSNPVLNTCWDLANHTVAGYGSSQCPVNPTSGSNSAVTENVGLCTGDCFVQTISSFYYGQTKICVNAAAALDNGSKILIVPSLLAAFLLLVLFL